MSRHDSLDAFCLYLLDDVDHVFSCMLDDRNDRTVSGGGIRAEEHLSY